MQYNTIFKHQSINQSINLPIQYNTIQYNTIQYNTIQYNTIQFNTIQYNTIQYNKLYLESVRIITQDLVTFLTRHKNIHVQIINKAFTHYN